MLGNSLLRRINLSIREQLGEENFSGTLHENPPSVAESTRGLVHEVLSISEYYDGGPG